MEARPPVLIETIVGLLVPAACREEVLGDLHERYTSMPRYVLAASAVIPFIVFSRMRRTADGLFLAMQAYALFLVFRPAHLNDPADCLRLAIPIGSAVLALLLCDAFEGSTRVSQEVVPDLEFDASVRRAAVSAVGAMTMVWLVQASLAFLGVDLELRLAAPAQAAAGGALMLLPIRVAWGVLFRGGGYRRVTLGSLKREDFTADAWRAALGRRRDILRRSWLWYAALPAVGGFARVAFERDQSLWPLAVEGMVTTAVALLLFKAFASRLAALLQSDLDALG